MNASDNLKQLQSLGFNQFFEDASTKLDVNLEALARVVAEHKGVYEIIGVTREGRASVTGRRMKSATGRDDYPAVGDWIVVKDGPKELQIVEHILPRQTTLRKKYTNKEEAQLMVANVDVAFIVESLNRDYSINRFERYLVLAREGGIKPVIVLNKSDLMTEAELTAKEQELHKRFPDVEVLRSSVVAEDGLKRISKYIQPGTTYCFVGSSGVGKSSIISRLVERTIDTKDIGAQADRGVHTTTSRRMYFTNGGGIIIDNPGSREVGVVDFRVSAREVFAEIQKLSNSCRYRNCSHTSEQGCAVAQAIASGDITAANYENYLRLQKETEHLASSFLQKRKKDDKHAKHVKKSKNDIKKKDEE